MTHGLGETMIIDVNNGIPIYLQIVEQIKTAALYGRYRSGDRVPPVRELALTLRVNPNTVAKAYRLLQEEGWLESRPGGGNFIVFQAEAEVARQREETLRQDLAAVLRKAEILGVDHRRLTVILDELLKQGDHE